MTTAPHAEVSVILPAFNGERYLEKTLRSAVGQSLPPLEVIVVDDGSSDSSGEIAESFGDPVRCLRQANAGVAAARNRGLSEARGEFIAFLDHDDLWPTDKLELQVSALRSNPDVDIVTGRMRVLGGAVPGRPWSVEEGREAPAGAHLPAALIRRSAFDRIGVLDESVGGAADDLEWIMRARDRGVRTLEVDAVTLIYRWHGENASTDIDAAAGGQLAALKLSLDRRRAEDGLMEDARVSVVIPVRDGAKYLGAAIESVLAQTRSPEEVVVVDDGSLDSTPAVIAGYGDRVTAIRQPRLGNASAVNRGIAAASGDYLAFLDADDLWTSEKLAVQLRILERDESIDAVFGLVQQFLSEDADPSLARRIVIPPAPQPGVSRPAMLIRRPALDRVGEFDEARSNGDFTDWYARAMENGLTTHMPEVVVAHRRIHGANLGIRHQDRQWPETLDVLKASLDRRRGS
ncbi:MAG TPA: glycosyltransferase family A protein [Solirubrobacterales bacterium]|jgi:glycosyltransferase involved in cell wall biosynthesis